MHLRVFVSCIVSFLLSSVQGIALSQIDSEIVAPRASRTPSEMVRLRIEALHRRGADLEKAHNVVYFFEASTQDELVSFVTELKSRGIASQSLGESKNRRGVPFWSLMVTKLIVPSEVQLLSSLLELEQLASRVGIAFVYWGIDPPK